MIASTTTDVDFLAARLHARRSRMAEGARLDAICRLPGTAELAATMFPADSPRSAADFQRRTAEVLARELTACAARLPCDGASLCAWLAARFQLENLKVLLRAALTQTPLRNVEAHLLNLPRELAIANAARLASAESADAFAQMLPDESLRSSLHQTARALRNQPQPFLPEAALDRGYLEELLRRSARLTPVTERDTVEPLARQEADIFLLMLAARGRFVHGIAPALLESLHVSGAGIGMRRFCAMLADPDIAAAAKRVAGSVIDAVPPRRGDAAADAASIESSAWTRYQRLANRAFRRSHMGIGAVAGYAGLRRIEAANLITVCEGLRRGIDGAELRARMLPRSNMEAARV